MDNVQFIKDAQGLRTHAILPMADYIRLTKMPGDHLSDEEFFELAMQERDPENTVPHEVVTRLVAGDNPIKVYREWRQLTQKDLAEKVSLKPLYISQLENKPAGSGSIRTLRRIASALEIDLDDLVPEQ